MELLQSCGNPSIGYLYNFFIYKFHEDGVYAILLYQEFSP